MLTHSFMGTHTHILLHTHTNRRPYIHTHTHTSSRTLIHTHTCTQNAFSHLHASSDPFIYTYEHTLTATQKGSQRDPEPEPGCQLWPTGQQKLRRAPCTQNTRVTQGPAPPALRFRTHLEQAGLCQSLEATDGTCRAPGPFLPLPGRLLSLSACLSALGKHLSPAIWGWRASASWLPRLTRRWAGASSELSDAGGGRSREQGQGCSSSGISGRNRHTFPSLLEIKRNKSTRLYAQLLGLAPSLPVALCRPGAHPPLGVLCHILTESRPTFAP